MRLYLAGLLLAASMPATSQGQTRNTPFPGTMTLNVDATDTEQGIFRVTQTIPLSSSGPMTLNFPKWLPGNHAPRGQIEKLAGLTIRAGGLSQWANPNQATLVRAEGDRGIIFMELEKAMKNPESEYNFILRPGDLINIQRV